MKVLLLTHRLPFAPDRGDRIRAFHIVKQLAARADVHVVPCGSVCALAGAIERALLERGGTAERVVARQAARRNDSFVRPAAAGNREQLRRAHGAISAADEPLDAGVSMKLRETVKSAMRLVAHIAAAPFVLTFALRSILVGRDRAIQSSTQLLALALGLTGQYLRRAFLTHTLDACHHTAVVEFGTTFSQAGTRLDARACHLGLVHVERDVLISAGVHIPSGSLTHRIDNDTQPIRDQPSARRLVRIGAGSWIGAAAVVMADVGRDSVVGAGAVVTQPVPSGVVTAGIPSRVLRVRRHRPPRPLRTADELPA